MIIKLMKTIKIEILRMAVLLICISASVYTSAQMVTIGGLDYKLFPETHEAILANGNNWVGELVIPAQVSYEGQDYVVKSIYILAFDNCKQLTKVTIPSTTDSIHHSTLKEGALGQISDSYMTPFIRCTALESIEVDENNPSMSSIGGVLFNKDGTRLYCYPAGMKADKYVVPEGVTWIGGNAFGYNENIVSIELPETVEKIYGGAFWGCKKLEEVNLPGKLTYIEAFMFRDCACLKSIEIPSGVWGLGEQAFLGCTSLKVIDLPKSVNYISNYAFSGCSLDVLVIRGQLGKEYMYDILLTALKASGTLYVPDSEIEFFKSRFTGTILPVEQYRTADIGKAPSSKVISHPLFDLGGRRLETSPKKGLFIYNGQKFVR
jgi:hypothetical protein